ncbi:MAG: fructose-1,6-bisphosphatase [Anaerovoracaceae bacterium]
MKELQYLKLLSEKYPNKKAACAEIINLSAILALPKGTEYFLSDLHGEFEAFKHMIKGASGVVRARINEIFGDEMSDEECYNLASLIYNPSAELKRRKAEEEDYKQWCYIAIFRLVLVAKAVSAKFTRSHVRKRFPKYWAYSLDELLHAEDEANKGNYYSQIIKSIIEIDMAESYIKELANSISDLAVDKLHIIGDVYDRGAHPDYIMDFLTEFHDVDIQWGNHDIVWMGAATGSWACITNILRMNISYNNFDMLEIGYGINLRPLTSFAQRVYGDDPCDVFAPKILDVNKFDPVSKESAAKMHKAIAIMQFKIEGQRIMAHPEYKLDNRLLLHKINFEEGTIELNGVTYELRDTNFPTIDPKDPYKLTDEEIRVLDNLEASILRSRQLQKHIRFLFSHGALYKVVNNNLLFHGCIPMTEEGEFEEIEIDGKVLKGKNYFDYLDSQVRKAYFNPEDAGEIGISGDLMWYLWLGSKSPLFGKDQMTTFERLFIADKKTHKENTVAYYKHRDNKVICDKILEEFGISKEKGHILNGHVPVKIKDGESPVKGGGKLFVIDGGISKAYQKQTGIAGYTFIYNSRFMALAEHKPYMPLQEDGTQQFFAPTLTTVETLKERMLVKDTDQVHQLSGEIEWIKKLIEAYRKGVIKEIY